MRFGNGWVMSLNREASQWLLSYLICFTICSKKYRMVLPQAPELPQVIITSEFEAILTHLALRHFGSTSTPPSTRHRNAKLMDEASWTTGGGAYPSWSDLVRSLINMGQVSLCHLNIMEPCRKLPYTDECVQRQSTTSREYAATPDGDYTRFVQIVML
jgi:hypothetical protein